MFDLWDIYQQIRIRDLDNRVDRIEGAPTTDALARDEVAGRVRATAAGLGYSVNRQARSLRRGRDEAIGLALEDFTIPFFGCIVAAVEQAAHERGYGVVISCAGAGRSEDEAVAPLLSRSVSGLVVATGTAGAPLVAGLTDVMRSD